MFDVPADTPWIWLGLTIASALMLGVVVGLPTAAPNAERVAGTIDEVAATEGGSTATVSLRATEIRLGPDRVGLRAPGGRAHASLQYGPVTPVRPGTRLASVLNGEPARAVFSRPGAFRWALRRAGDRTPRWRSAGDRLRIKHASYGEVNGVLVGA